MTMSDAEPTLKFIAQQLLEVHELLQDLPVLAERLGRVEQRLTMLHGWTEAEEKISLEHTRKLQSLDGKLSDVRGMLGDVVRNSKQIEILAKHLQEAEQQLGGVVELAASTYDIVVKKLGDQGGEDGQSTRTAAAASG